MSEFDLIAKHFTRSTTNADLGVGDDAALVSVTTSHQLAISADMLVAGTHFFHDADPCKLGWKCLAVNVSDMAAMGATPKWATLAIALPNLDDAWLAEFSRGFFECANKFHVSLIGGDTTRTSHQEGPTISVQIMGELPMHSALQRDGAKSEEDIWVSGPLGSAALGLAYLQHKANLDTLGLKNTEIATFLDALHQPQPRVALGLALRNIASSCIDISDGLLADLGHILKASNCGATIDLAHVPCHNVLRGQLNHPLFQQMILAGGDDYELCFTAPKYKRAEVEAIALKTGLPLSIIGQTHTNKDLNIYHQNKKLTVTKKGFDHFS